MSSIATSTRAEPNDLLSIAKELQLQQMQITENQTKADAKIVDLADAVRVARIYTSRLGGTHKAPTPPPRPRPPTKK
jgi:hypothetical protein